MEQAPKLETQVSQPPSIEVAAAVGSLATAHQASQAKSEQDQQILREIAHEQAVTTSYQRGAADYVYGRDTPDRALYVTMASQH